MTDDATEATDNMRVAELTRLSLEADAGRFELLECPQCRQSTVDVWFTNPAPDEYRTWFVCDECDFHARVHNSCRPKHFSRLRVNEELQERDAEIVRKAIFKRPPRPV